MADSDDKAGPSAPKQKKIYTTLEAVSMIFEDKSVENNLNDGFMSDDSLEDENVSDTEMETMVPETVRHQLEDSVRRDEEEISDQERVESDFFVDDTGDNEPEQ